MDLNQGKYFYIFKYLLMKANQLFTNYNYLKFLPIILYISIKRLQIHHKVWPPIIFSKISCHSLKYHQPLGSTDKQTSFGSSMLSTLLTQCMICLDKTLSLVTEILLFGNLCSFSIVDDVEFSKKKFSWDLTHLDNI